MDDETRGLLTRPPFWTALVLIGSFCAGLSQVSGFNFRDVAALWKPVMLSAEERAALRGRLRELASDGTLSVDESQDVRAYAESLKLETRPVEQYLAEIEPRMLLAARSLQEGVELAARERFPEARARFLASTRLDDESSTAWANLGGAALESGDTVEAEAALRKALALDPSSIEANYNLGACLAAQNRDAAALDHLERSLNLLQRADASPTFERRALLADLETSGHFSSLRASPRFAALIERARNDFR